MVARFSLLYAAASFISLTSVLAGESLNCDEAFSELSQRIISLQQQRVEQENLFKEQTKALQDVVKSYQEQNSYLTEQVGALLKEISVLGSEVSHLHGTKSQESQSDPHFASTLAQAFSKVWSARDNMEESTPEFESMNGEEFTRFGRSLLSSNSSNEVIITRDGVTAYQMEATDDVTVSDVALVTYMTWLNYTSEILEDYILANDEALYLSSFFGAELSDDTLVAIRVNNSANSLNGPSDIATLTISSEVYAFVPSSAGGTVQAYAFDLTNPSKPRNITSSISGLSTPYACAAGEVSSTPYLFVAESGSDSVSIYDISDPSSPSSVTSIVDGATFTSLGGAFDVKFEEVDSTPYLFVTSNADSAFQIVDVSTPSSPTSASVGADGGSYTSLASPSYSTIATISGSTYWFIAATGDDAVEIVDVSDPTNPSEAGFVVDGSGDCDALGGVYDLDYFSDGNLHYIIAVSSTDSGFQIINVTEPSSPSCIASGTDGTTFDTLSGATGVRVVSLARLEDTQTTVNFAIVASPSDTGFQLVDLADPSTPVSAGSYTNSIANRRLEVVETSGEYTVISASESGNSLSFYDFATVL